MCSKNQGRRMERWCLTLRGITVLTEKWGCMPCPSWWTTNLKAFLGLIGSDSPASPTGPLQIIHWRGECKWRSYITFRAPSVDCLPWLLSCRWESLHWSVLNSWTLIHRPGSSGAIEVGTQIQCPFAGESSALHSRHMKISTLTSIPGSTGDWRELWSST